LFQEEHIEPLERELVVALRRAERTIALLERVQAENGADERARLLRAWSSGGKLAPDFRYGAAAELSGVRRMLELVARAPSGGSVRIELCAERARELDLEARLVEALGSPEFVQLARERFAPDPEELGQAETWAREWVSLAAPGSADVLHVSDDAADPESLIAVLGRRIGRERLPVRIDVIENLGATAATGEGVIRIRRGVRLSARAAERIALHEIRAHALPRLLSRGRAGIEAAGSAGAADDEEGRALWLEEQSGYWDEARKIELAQRHLAALALRDGASFVETVELLLERGAPLEATLELACRVFRGGGLAREVVYLTGYARVRRAFEHDAELEPLLARARLGVRAAQRLLERPRAR
jgi:hypothetical protein